MICRIQQKQAVRSVQPQHLPRRLTISSHAPQRQTSTTSSHDHPGMDLPSRTARESVTVPVGSIMQLRNHVPARGMIVSVVVPAAASTVHATFSPRLLRRGKGAAALHRLRARQQASSPGGALYSPVLHHKRSRLRSHSHHPPTWQLSPPHTRPAARPAPCPSREARCRRQSRRARGIRRLRARKRSPPYNRAATPRGSPSPLQRCPA